MFGNQTPIYSFRGPMGVQVEVASSFLGLLILIFLISGGNLIWAASIGAMLVGAIFLHELGHAWGCIVQGIPVKRIMLYAGGGFCERARSGSTRQQELIVAMGPIVNLVLWAVTGLIADALPTQMVAGLPGGEPFAMPSTLAQYLLLFGHINIALFLFNMVPVQPLDGGKLFLLALMRALPTRRATRIAGAVGLVFAVLWIPALLLLFVATGWILFFFPSLRLHWQMWRQGAG